MNLPQSEPLSFTAGDNVAWTRSAWGAQFPSADGWGLKYYFAIVAGDATANKIEVTATRDSDDGFVVQLNEADSKDLAAGRYEWQARVSRSTPAAEQYTLANGITTIEESIFGATGQRDRRTHNRKVLDAVNANLENRANPTQKKYQIDGRSLENFKPEELLVLRDRYQQAVMAEDQAEKLRRGLGDNRKSRVRFA